MSVHNTRHIGDVKIVMLKGEKGLKGSAANVAWGDVEGDIADQADLSQALFGKADSEHSHSIGDIQSLQQTLDDKLNASDTISIGASEIDAMMEA